MNRPPQRDCRGPFRIVEGITTLLCVLIIASFGLVIPLRISRGPLIQVPGLALGEQMILAIGILVVGVGLLWLIDRCPWCRGSVIWAQGVPDCPRCGARLR